MKRITGFCFALIFVLVFSAMAESSLDLTAMSVEELSALRDKISQELSSRLEETKSPSVFELENDSFLMSITSIDVVDKNTINEYYDRYDPGTGTSDDYPCLTLLFTFENKSSATIDDYIAIQESSVNGWMVSSYCGIREIAPSKKGKGFLYAQLLDCEAENIEDIDSYEFKILVRDTDRNTLGEGKIILAHSGGKWIVNQ